MLALARLLAIPAALATGIYAGALTSTPALAASLQAVNDPAIPVGYGVAYPIGIIGVLLFVELVPRLLRIDWREENVRAEQGRARDAAAGREERAGLPPAYPCRDSAARRPDLPRL